MARKRKRLDIKCKKIIVESVEKAVAKAIEQEQVLFARLALLVVGRLQSMLVMQVSDIVSAAVTDPTMVKGRRWRVKVSALISSVLE